MIHLSFGRKKLRICAYAGRVCLCYGANREHRCGLTRPRNIPDCESSNEFVEVFELAETGKDYELYTEGRFRRKK
jgi:hypothetical protein